MYSVFKKRPHQKSSGILPPHVAADRLPQHIAIVMDGNGRWATKRGLPRIVGHQRGAEALRRTIQTCHKISIKYLTVFAFSTENWQRPLDEVSGLMLLLKRYLKSELAQAHQNNIRVRIIGNRNRLETDLVALIDHAVKLTASNTGLNLTIALDYGGRDDVVQAARLLAASVQSGQLKLEDIDEALFSQTLMTRELPDPDLFIRTSDTKRMSNFLIWQAAYTELAFIDTYWPDFSEKDLFHAIEHFQKCDRKFGRVSGQ